MRVKLTTLLTFLASFAGITAFSQVSFDDYKPLVSVGKIPGDFYIKTADKIETDMKNKESDLKNSEKKSFLREIHYGVDQLLQSGVVVYGDEVSNYVETVGKRLLKIAGVKEKIRFYTIKSNVSNALSTDQGIIFVTTGLISQLVNEAQLALILAHEISHFTEHHVVETFEYKSTKNFRNQIVQLATYSKDKEFEADVLGLELYHKAGYTKEQVRGTFDVLMYSYLPFDEIKFPKDYFSSDLCFIPESLFPTERYEIKAEEDYDDTRSSHPNIQRRKETIMDKADDLDDWGKTLYFEGEKEFKYIRNICRFETVRADLLSANYGRALYSIFLLERDYPKSIFLNRMKAQAWLGISAFKSAGEIYSAVDSKDELEGESAALHYFLRELSTKEMITLGMRQIEDIRKVYPEDREIGLIWERMIKTFYNAEGVDFEDYKELNFQKYNQDFAAKIKEMKNPNDEAAKEEEKKEEELSKYDRIKRKKSDSPSSTDDSVDSTKYYLYNLSDLKLNEAFTTKLDDIKAEQEKQEAEEEKIDEMSSKEYKQYVKEGNLDDEKIDLSNFVLVEPIAVSYGKKGIKIEKSEELQETYSEAALLAVKELGINTIYVDKSVFKTIGTDGYNQKALYTSLLIQLNNSAESTTFPVDYSLLYELQQQNNTSKVIFTIVEHNYHVEGWGLLVATFIFPPALPPLLVNKLIKGHNTEVSLIVMDIEKGEIENGASYYFNEPANKYLLSGRFYKMLYDLMQH